MAASSSRPLLRRLAELARGRVRDNHRMLSSASSSTAAIERASQSPAEAQAVRMTEGCVRQFNTLQRLKELHAKEPSDEGATVDYEEELARSAFVVSTNPSAVGGCSCKSSFMVK
ncbi:unnamed protein product [Miscanthus lutarioriparius]|uniref:Uncharacterized protein n=1 Tax=Miscanthus lutarioriparius TaxID=422564 RepID=A0A811R6C1_9POAL|nr:unnamed protein product [Miscanthus lutarioriparius]